jgi:fructokinase
MTDEPARSATLAAIRIAKDAGALISYDPNYRASLWPQESDAVTQMRALVPLADMMKLSEEEAPLLTGETDPMRALDALEQSGVTVAALTRGEKGALIRCKGQTIESPAFSVTAVDTTGAGDIFWGTFTVCLLQSGISIGRLIMRELSDFARRANAAAALSITKHGGIPSIPTAEEVDAFLSAHKTVEAFS